MAKRNDLRALRDLISEAQAIIGTTDLPEERSHRAHQLLSAAISLADELLEQRPAVILGAKGGKVTAKRGPDYFRKIASMRTQKKGGRPPEQNFLK